MRKEKRYLYLGSHPGQIFSGVTVYSLIKFKKDLASYVSVVEEFQNLSIVKITKKLLKRKFTNRSMKILLRQ